MAARGTRPDAPARSWNAIIFMSPTTCSTKCLTRSCFKGQVNTPRQRWMSTATPRTGEARKCKLRMATFSRRLVDGGRRLDKKRMKKERAAGTNRRIRVVLQYMACVCTVLRAFLVHGHAACKFLEEC
ncbi:hypothetical protein BS78_03G051400 [Paspalum vaginatum]|nr:hypothetical protein BS78_03G051400 [Paspalum vaginatum]